MTIETTRLTTPLAQHDPTGVLTPSEAVTAAIHAWVSGLDVAVQGAMFIVDTPACPDSLWPLPPGVTASKIPGKNPKLMLPDESRESYLARRTIAAQTAGSIVRYGLGLGLPPEVSLQGIFVIGGRYSMYAEQMVALIKSRGHKHKVIERSAEQCVVQVKHRTESDWEEFTFTMDDAIKAGYVKGKGPNTGSNEWKGNDKYNTDPKGMLYARVSSIACKIKFPDDLRGMVTYEEMLDERSRPQDDDAVRTITTVTASDIKARVAPGAAAIDPVPSTRPTAEPAAEGASVAELAPESPPADLGAAEELIDLAQNRGLHALLRKLDLGAESDKAVALAAISYIVKRPIDSTKFITKAEASPLLDRLDELSKKPEAKWRAEIRFMVTPDANGQLPMPEANAADA